MIMADLQASIDHLDAAGKILHQNWESLQPLWNDIVRQHFEKDCWTTIENNTRATLVELRSLAQMIAEARLRVH